MKLPPQKQSGVQSLGRLSTALPGKVYRAQQHAITAFQGAMDTFGQIGVKIYEQNAAAEHSKLNAEYMDRMNAAKNELEREPYRQNMGTDGKPTGELISRHTEILDEYNQVEDTIRTEILAKSTNNLSFRKLTEDLNQGGVAYRERIRTTAANWAVADSNRSFRESFRINIANNRFDAADQDLVKAIKTGSISPGEGDRFAAEILAKREYRTGELLVDSLAADNITLEKVHELHRVFNEGENYANMLPQQVAALHSKLDYKLQDMMAEDVAVTIDTMSLADGEAAIHSYMDRRWDKSGFSDERNYTSAIGHLWNVYNQRRDRNVKAAGEIELNQRVIHIANGGWADPDWGVDKKAMDIVFNQRLEAAGNPSEGSNGWIRVGGEQARTQGWIPPYMERYVRGNLLHMSHDSDVGSVSSAAKTVAYIDRHANRTLRNLDKKDLATALLINEATNAGVSSMDAFIKIREGIERVPEETQVYRTAAYNSEHSKNAGAVLEEKLNDKFGGFFSGGKPEFNSEMTARYNTLTKQNFVLTGHKEIAENMAFDELMHIYGVTERSGDRRMEYKPPEAVLDDAVPEKVNEYVNDEFNQIVEELNLDKENVLTVHKIDAGAENAWFMYDIDKGDFVTNPDGLIVKWQPSYRESRIGKIDALKEEQQRIQEELEVERQRNEYNAKWSRYESDLENLNPVERVQRQFDMNVDDAEEYLRSITELNQEAGEGIVKTLTPSSKSPTRENSRKANSRRRRYETLKRQVGAEPNSKLEAQVKRLEAIDKELENLE